MWNVFCSFCFIFLFCFVGIRCIGQDKNEYNEMPTKAWYYTYEGVANNQQTKKTQLSTTFWHFSISYVLLNISPEK